jgi:hypothetical protein
LKISPAQEFISTFIHESCAAFRRKKRGAAHVL